MSRLFFAVAFATGLMVVAWVGLGFVGSSWLAVLVTTLIAAAYVLGAVELQQFRAATSALAEALAGTPAPLSDLNAWLERVPTALRPAVRQRIEGERIGLPGPALTPYLVGLLVMLGMLGTFLGMVVTFKGAVGALEGSTDLHAIRAALATPIKGLGQSFGTSVAGVAASAMLGLMSAMCRRDRLHVARLLDGRVATVFKPFSLAYLRQETFKTLQQQATALPEVLDRLQAMMEGMERRSQQLNAQLTGQQAQFHRDASVAYTELASAVGQSLQDSLRASTQVASESLMPVIQSAMAAISQESASSHQRLMAAAQLQFQEMSAQFGRSAEHVSAVLSQAQSAQAEADEQRLAAWAQQLEAQAASLRGEWARVGTQTLAQQQAAADLLTQWRQEMARLTERDQLALAERAALMGQIRELLDALNQTSADQSATVQSLSQSAVTVLSAASQQYVETLATHADKAADMAAHVRASAVELASLGESFHQGIQLFNAGNDKLMASLQRIEGAISQSMARSDEQLAYYVAQAREVIDLSISAQQGIVEDLRRLHGKPAWRAEGAQG